jgi:flagellar basal-body rod modification protein FlgD
LPRPVIVAGRVAAEARSHARPRVAPSLLGVDVMIPPSLAISAATSAFSLISSIASKATSNGTNASSGSGSNSFATNGTNTTSSTGTSGTGKTGAVKGKENDIVNQAEFMKLLIAQLQNQDPLNPLDSANFSAQLAQFSSLEQLTQINDKLGAQAANQNGRFDAVSFIGREVTGASLGIQVKDGVATTLDYSLSRAGAVTAKIVNEKGEQIANLVLGSEGAGAHTFDLAKIPNAPDLEDGVYAVVVSQADPATGLAAAVPTSITGTVTGVDLTGDEPTLLLGDIPLVLTDVTQITQPAASSN